MNPVHLIHRYHHRAAVGSNDQHARHDPRPGDNASGGVQPQQFHQRQAGDQGAAHIRHAQQRSRTLVRQRMDRLQRRNLRQATGDQPQPLFAQAKHHRQLTTDN